MSKAFLSHSSVQKSLIESIAAKLGRDNCVVDKYNFEVGTPTLDSILDEIDKSDLFVLFLSDEALDSEWVQREIKIIDNLRDSKAQKKVLVFLVDPTIDYKDPRIPTWLSKDYNLKSTILDPVLLFKKIDSKLRDISIENHPFVKAKEEIFVGRNGLMEEFEKKYYNLENIKPTAIIASGFEEIGRRKFLKNALHKVERLNKYHEPVTIYLDSRDSIEDFILRLEDLQSRSAEEIISKIREESIAFKIEYAENLIKNFQDSGEILFIIDNGCIVQHNKEIARWFIEVINLKSFKNNTLISLISRFRPYPNIIQRHSSLIAFHVVELTPSDRQLLFLKYCEMFGISPVRQETEKILSILNGMPGQIYHCAKMINDDGIDRTIGRLEDIKRLHDIKVFQIIDGIRKLGDLYFNILVFISKFEFISYKVLYKIFDRNDEFEEIIDTLFIHGVYDRIGVNKEYIQVHHAISDYVKRAKFPLDQKIKDKLAIEIEVIMKDGGDQYPDVSQLLVTVKALIESKKTVPERYFIPSFVLRVILGHYYEGNYKQVDILAQTIIGNHLKYDPYIVKDIRYQYCMSLCRQGKEEFFNQVRYFEGLDHHFLLGFYKRIKTHFTEAEKHFRQALSIDERSQKTRRELVNVLLSQSRYAEALKFAQANYERYPLNAFHIQGYFKSLVRKNFLTPGENEVLKELMENIQKSHDFKAKEIYLTMIGEFEYYVNKDFTKAVDQLKSAIENSSYKDYPKKALLEIYNKRGLRNEEEKLKKQIDNTKNSLIDSFDFDV